MTIKLRLIFEVEYEPDGTSLNILKAMLTNVVARATGDGMLTEGTPATVENYEYRVEVVR